MEKNMEKNIKKNTILAVVLIIFLIAIGFFGFNFVKKQQEEAKNALISGKLAFVNKVLDEFKNNPNAKASEISQKVLDEFNKIDKNPYNKNALFYTFDKNCKGCNSVEFDDNLEMVILTTYDKKGALVARTVIKPPSFVTYEKEDENKGEE